MVAYQPQKGKENMKIPKPRKLPSGSWFVRVQIDGQTISITKPTEKACIAEAVALKAGIKKAKKSPANTMTLYNAIDDYISQRENILSPSTISGYRVIQRNRFKQLHRVKVSDIDSTKWQKAVNQEAKVIVSPTTGDKPAKHISAKTLKNSAMFVQTVIAEYGGERLSARLPQLVPNDLPWLTPEQIPEFLKAIKGSKYEIPALLALSSLRQSEIVAIRWKDIDLEKGCILVHGAAVRDEHGALIQKSENKNLSSRRTVPFIIPQLKTAVEKQEVNPDDYVYPKYSNVLRLNINKACAEAGLPSVGVHGLRRSFASLCYHLGVSEAVTMISGGWSDFRTMRKIYTKISQNDIQAQAQKFTAFFVDAKENCNKNCNG